MKKTKQQTKNKSDEDEINRLKYSIAELWREIEILKEQILEIRLKL